MGEVDFSGKADRASQSSVRPRRDRRSSITISQQAYDHLLRRPLDPSLLDGATNALENALGLKGGERLVLIVETGSEAIGTAFVRGCETLALQTRTYVVGFKESESDGFRARLYEQLDGADASILIGTVGGLSPEFRREVCTRPGRRRHAHMVGVTVEMMRQSMRADWVDVHRLGEQLKRHLLNVQTIEITSGPLDVLRVQTDPRCRWHNGSGLLRKPGFANLPGGEVATSPGIVSGSFRADGGAFLPDGSVLRTPLRLVFERGVLVDVEGHGRERVLDAVDADLDGRRIGQIAFGTNTNVLTPIGAMLQDLKMPGCHLVLGYTCPELTGATWTSTVMVPLVCRRPDVVADGEPLMVRGRYTRLL